MSLGQRVTGFEPRTCPKCGAVQESLGSTVCEQCGTDLDVARLAKSWPPRPATPLGERLRSPARALAAVPALLLRRGVGALRSFVFLILRFAFLFLRRAALLLVLAGIVVGLSYVPAVRARVPVAKEVAATAQAWLQRGEDLVRRLVPGLKRSAQPQRQTTSPSATAKKPAATAPVSTKPSLTVRSTPSGATVLLGTRRVGKTPLTFKLAPGTYKVTVSRPGYLSATRTIIVKAGKSAAMNVTLNAAP